MIRSLHLLLAFVLLIGCASSGDEWGPPHEGPFSPELQLLLEPDASQTWSPGLLNVAHTVTNLSPHPIWACRMTDYRLKLGQHGHLSITTPAGCEFHGVLAAGESITWNRQIEITTRCSDYEELKRKIPSIADRLPACRGSIELEAATTFHVAPTGEEWPKNQQVIVLEVEGPAVEVASCDPDSDLLKGQPAPNTLVPRDPNPRGRGFGPVNSDR